MQAFSGIMGDELLHNTAPSFDCLRFGLYHNIKPCILLRKAQYSSKVCKLQPPPNFKLQGR